MSFTIMDRESMTVTTHSETSSSSASVNESTKNRSRDPNSPICQNCMSYTKIETVGWCRTKEEHTARKATCEYFRRRKK